MGVVMGAVAEDISPLARYQTIINMYSLIYMKRNYKKTVIFMISSKDGNDIYIGGTTQRPTKRMDTLIRYNFNSYREFDVLKNLIASDSKVEILENVECENKQEFNEKVTLWRQKYNVEYLDHRKKPTDIISRPSGSSHSITRKEIKKNCVHISTEDTTIVWD